ncbi:MULTISPECIES: YgjP-like metallopeptidase domain-containing protein [unclassified Pseudoalteromonas]|uniref:M48 metallopeptidase family protein n=1 Tax=unclassified Pseudoalteromonas TaxID=194690 RepID=UPI00209718AD|nr:YgjP-like metallopeptidase domain-containing protein [Pseudoalteromonas sp. XMcav2-N]MCO7187097.1 DUF45 domain-containing protein [Pseudoalteromonas sp. XMcav2-N]
MNYLPYFQHYPPALQSQIKTLLEPDKLAAYFKSKYPQGHQLQSTQALYDYCHGYKNKYLKNVPRLHKVNYAKGRDLMTGTLGHHSQTRKQHGGKVKTRYEIALSQQLKYAPEAVLRALVVHELAHFKELDHNKAFYQLCCHMEPEYHQLELDLRLFIVLNKLGASFYEHPAQPG